jgi:nucleotide-binding universal stress UspA family protein
VAAASNIEGIMTHTKCILCPVDFSEFSRHALDCAVRLARHDKARVVALHVFTNWPAVDVVPSLTNDTLPKISLKDVDREALLRLLKEFVAPSVKPRVTLETLVTESSAVHREILTQAEATHADVIVMGSHGRSGFQRLLLGSITEKVLRAARCPVMVVPAHVMSPAGTSGRPFTRILCPVDFSCDALAALSRACDLARQAKAPVTVLNVIDVPAALYEMPGFDIDGYRRDAVSRSRARLSELIPKATARGLEVIVSDGRPDHEILRVAVERGVDLIVMGGSGRHAVDLAVFGSTTHRVVRGASCPVLTIRREQSAS